MHSKNKSFRLVLKPNSALSLLSISQARGLRCLCSHSSSNCRSSNSSPLWFTLAPPSVHHSNGSFGSVFIVLAVIIVVSAIACFLGRLCNRRYRSQKPKENHHYHNHHNHRPKQSGDIEFGFDKKGSAAKPGGNGGSRGHKGFETVDHIKGGMKPAEREGYLRTDA
jgi:hypothetical protein